MTLTPWRKFELLERINRRECMSDKSYPDKRHALGDLICYVPTDPVGVWRLTLAGQQELARYRAMLALADQVDAVYREVGA